MMRGLPVAALACLSACAQLFGIDNTTGTSTPGAATLSLTRNSVGAGVTSSPQDVSALTATFFVPDAADPTQLDAIPGMQTDVNVWSADVGSANPAVVYTEPDLPMAHQHSYALPARAVRTYINVLEHPNAQPP